MKTGTQVSSFTLSGGKSTSSRRKPGPMQRLQTLDSGFRRNDGAGDGAGEAASSATASHPPSSRRKPGPMQRLQTLDSGFRRNDGAENGAGEVASLLAEREGIVIGAHAGITRIRLEQAAACAGCGSRGTCASAAVPATPQFIDVRLSETAVPGAHVTLSLPESSIALAAVLGYLFPVLGVLFGALIATVLFAGDLPAVLGAVLGLLIGLLGVRLASGRFCGSYMTPRVCPSTSLNGDLS